LFSPEDEIDMFSMFFGQYRTILPLMIGTLYFVLSLHSITL